MTDEGFDVVHTRVHGGKDKYRYRISHNFGKDGKVLVEQFGGKEVYVKREMTAKEFEKWNKKREKLGLQRL